MLASKPVPRWLPWLIATAGFFVDIAAWWPGQMSFDSAYAWWQVRGGETTTIVSPAMIFVWRVCDAILAGPGLLFALHLALFWSGLALIASALRSRVFVAAAIMFFVAFVPASFLLRAHVWTDVGLLSTLTFATGALMTAQAAARRSVWLIAAIVALYYAAALRHNALPAVVPFAAWWMWLEFARLRTSRRSWALATLTLCAALAIGVGALNARVARQVPVWTSLAQWDLAALSIASNEMLLPDFMIGPGLDVTELGAAFRPWSNVPMLQNTRHGMRDPFMGDYSPEQLSALRHAWLTAIAEHPGAWLAHRWRLVRALIGAHDPSWPRELIFVDDEFQYRDNPPISRNGSWLHRALMRLAAACANTPLLAAWPYLLIGLLAIPAGWRKRGEPAGRTALILLGSAWLYALTLFAFAPSAELRYAGWTIVASLLAAATAWSSAMRKADRLSASSVQGSA